MNFITEFNKGQSGGNFGLSTGLIPLDKAIDGVQRKSLYCIAAAPKVGKTAFVDQSFVLEPYLFTLKNPEIEVDWIYFSFEIDRVKKEFKYAAFFFYKDYGISNFEYNGKIYEMCSRYLLGKMRDDFGCIIPVTNEHREMLKEIYEKRIAPLFGRYSITGKKIVKGKIDFIEERTNPTGIRNYLLNYAKENGTFLYEKYSTTENNLKIVKERIVGYRPHNPRKYVVVVLDHIRKMNKERGFNIKENIDKMVDYQVELRNWCSFTFIDIVHINRNLDSVERIKYMSEFLYPTGGDTKDSGNLAEDCDFLITLFNPHDEKYNIKKHFGLDISDIPNYRSVHLVESRDTDCPQHLKTKFYGNINLFTPL